MGILRIGRLSGLLFKEVCEKMINHFTVWYTREGPTSPAISLGVRRSGLSRLCEDSLEVVDTIRITR